MPEVIKLFSCSAQLSMKFKMLISIKISRNSAFFRLRLACNAVFPAINVEMPTVAGILTLMSSKIFMLSRVERENFPGQSGETKTSITDN